MAIARVFKSGNSQALLPELVNLDAPKNRKDDKPQKRKGL
jgi:virulence-associated protein VagC